MSSEGAISVRNLSKEYELGLSGRTRSIGTVLRDRLRHPVRGGGEQRERFLALDDVSFEIAEGDAVGVIGRNGAGKSTLLKILSRITKPSAGVVEMSSSVGSLLEVGTGFHPELTGLENVYLNGTILGMARKEIDRRLEEIIEFSEIGRFLTTPVKRYSSGMRVRLAFAVAAHLDPEVLIVDEVLSVGDFAFQAKCLDKMRTIAADEGRTVLYVSHNLVTVENLCTRGLLLAGGKLVYDGDTDETIARYLHTRTRADHDDASGVFDLTNAAGEHHGPAKDSVFKRVTIRPGGVEAGETARMGDRLRIEIDVEGLDAEPDANVTLTFSPSTTAQALCRISARMRPLRSSAPRQAREQVVIDLASVPFTPGEYQIYVGAFAVDGTVLDEVHEAAEFTVIPADVLGNGYPFQAPKDGFVVLDGWEWELRPSTAGGP